MTQVNTTRVFICGEHYSDFKAGEVVPAYLSDNTHFDTIQVTVSIHDVMYVFDRPDIKNKIASGNYPYIVCITRAMRDNVSWQWL